MRIPLLSLNQKIDMYKLRDYQQKASGAATLGAFTLSVNKANEVGIFVGLRSIFKSISVHLTIVVVYAIIIYIEII